MGPTIRKQPTEDELLKLREINIQLGLLKKHPGWKILQDKFYRDKERDEQVFGHMILTGGPVAAMVDQRKVDYERGIWSGVKKVFDTPEAAERWLEKDQAEGKE